MLSKEKIEKQAKEKWGFLKEKQENNPQYYYWDAMERGSIDGATWASEQYAGVVKELKGLIKRWNQSELTMEYLEETFPTLEEELNKLKQP